MSVDVEISGAGTVFSEYPLTEAAHRWLEVNVGSDAIYMHGALMVEWRYLDEIIDGMLDDGLEVVRT